ncbi:ATP-binding protein [Gallaecimonas sp. GXIMD4217]|uniref:ATP-binding protein n=1 Tax=Gallaecimonas sp. GXIMD4217 TaxID=3131927 RepID=UPI00311B3C96
MPLLPENPLSPSLTRQLLSLRYALWLSEGAMLAWIRFAGLDFDYPLLLACWLGHWLAISLNLLPALRRRHLLPGLLLDIAALTLLFALSGARANPFVSLYLLPVVITVLLMPGRPALLAGLAAALGYSGLMLLPESHQWHQGGHYWGMWANGLLTLVLLLFFAGRMGAQLSRQRQHLAELREEQLRSERVMAVAGQAALAAHQLSTPLSVARLSVDELALESADPRLVEIRTALERCQQALLGIRAAADQAEHPHPMALAELFEQLDRQWQLLRPGIPLWLPDAGDIRIRGDASLVPALLNLLDNSAHAGGGRPIEIRCRQGDGKLLLHILDQGQGLGPELALDRPRESDKGGLGLGLFLAHASLERLGGRLSLAEVQGQHRVEVSLCLS